MMSTDDFQVDDHTKFANNYNFVSFLQIIFLLFLLLLFPSLPSIIPFFNLLLLICVQEYTHAKELSGGQRTEKINCKMKDL